MTRQRVIVVRPRPAKLTLTGHAPTIQVRQYVTMQHLWTARHTARQCSERELHLQANDIDTEHRSLVITETKALGRLVHPLVHEAKLTASRQRDGTAPLGQLAYPCSSDAAACASHADHSPVYLANAHANAIPLSQSVDTKFCHGRHMQAMSVVHDWGRPLSRGGPASPPLQRRMRYHGLRRSGRQYLNPKRRSAIGEGVVLVMFELTQ